MKLKFKKSFLKSVAKLSTKQQKQLNTRLKLFMKDPFNPQLNNHALKGKYEHCRSINISGDLREIYILETEKCMMFIFLGTHSDLYG